MLDPTANRLERYLDLLSARQKVVASNVANVDTPGYKTRDIDFHFEFMGQVDGLQPQVVEAAGLKTRNDGNNVSLDRESRLLAENAIRFNAAANLLKSHIRLLRTAIQEGKA